MKSMRVNGMMKFKYFKNNSSIWWPKTMEIIKILQTNSFQPQQCIL